MATRDPAPATGAAEDERIRWALAHPGVSPWVKDALRATRSADPVAVLNDLELLDALLRPACAARIDAGLAQASPGHHRRSDPPAAITEDPAVRMDP